MWVLSESNNVPTTKIGNSYIYNITPSYTYNNNVYYTLKHLKCKEYTYGKVRTKKRLLQADEMMGNEVNMARQEKFKVEHILQF